MADWLGKLRGWLGALSAGPQPQPESPKAVSSSERPHGRLIWIHDAAGQHSAQVDALAELLEELDADVTILWTGPAQNAPDFARFIEPPKWESNAQARSFVQKWAPDLALFLGGAAPGAMIAECQRQNTPRMLVQLADRATPPRTSLRRLSHFYATDRQAIELLTRQGILMDRIAEIGALFDGAAPPEAQETERARFAQVLAGRPSWLAAATTISENPIMVAAHARASRRSHRLLLILNPADPARADELYKSLRREGWRVARRTAGELPDEETQIYLADAPDEIGLWFRVAPVSFMGGSLDPRSSGGIDPHGAAALGSAILHGPNLGHHATDYATLDAAQAARTIRDAQGLARLLDVFNAPEKAAELAHNAWKVSTEGAEATTFLAQEIMDRLTEREES